MPGGGKSGFNEKKRKSVVFVQKNSVVSQAMRA